MSNTFDMNMRKNIGILVQQVSQWKQMKHSFVFVLPRYVVCIVLIVFMYEEILLGLQNILDKIKTVKKGNQSKY